MAEEEVQEAKSSGGGKGLIIVLIIMMFLMMIGMGVLAFLLLSKDDGKKSDSSSEEQHASADYADEHDDEGAVEDGVPRNYSPKFKQYVPPEPGSPPLYFEMEQFVVNFKGEGQAKFLAVTLKFMSHYPELVGETGDMSHLRPILRNDITSLLRKQTFTEMNGDEGPDILRARILEKAREIVKKHGIYPDLLEDVYFDRFVMQ